MKEVGEVCMEKNNKVFSYVVLLLYSTLPYLLMYYIARFKPFDGEMNELFLLLICISGIAISGCVIYLLYRRDNIE